MAEDGSSPPVRGTLSEATDRRNKIRFIPACAGNTPDSPEPSTMKAVHPRLCGEHSVEAVEGSTATGSSPPVRGTLFSQDTKK